MLGPMICWVRGYDSEPNRVSVVPMFGCQLGHCCLIQEGAPMPKSASEPAVRPSLTRERIVLAAIEVIERDGEDALSMRAVAAELGVAVMSLYNHVPNKADLLSGVAQHVVAGMVLPDDSADDWKTRGRALI